MSHIEEIPRHLIAKKKFFLESSQEDQIAFINKYKSPELPDVGVAETGHPDIGRVIGLYIMAQDFDKSFEEEADNLLDSVIDGINPSIPLCIDNGLLSLGAGLMYLLRNNFIAGDEDEILEDIDKKVFLSVIHFEENKNVDWEGVLYYLRKRASLQDSKNLLIQLNVKKTILHVIEIYKRFRWSESASFCDRINNGLDGFYKDNLFRSLISCVREDDESGTYGGNVIKTDSITFVIPLRIDSKERYSNLLVIIDSLLAINNSEIIILEADASSKFDKGHCSGRVQHHFIEDSDPIFYRTKYLNKLLKMTSNPIVGIWDADVIFHREQIEESIKQIKEGHVIMSFPYNGRFYVTPSPLSDTFREKRDIRVFDEQKDELSLAYGSYSVGGAFIVNKEVYCRIGGENEYFYGWGAEDIERVKRLEILGYKIHRSDGGLYHLFHQRNNSWYANENIETITLGELIKVSNMSAEELTAYIKTWDWTS